MIELGTGLTILAGGAVLGLVIAVVWVIRPQTDKHAEQHRKGW